MHVRKFARKARRYTCAYYVIDNNVHKCTETFVDNNGTTVIDLTGGTTLPSIERLVKQFKIHRCTLDFATKFITTEAKTIVITKVGKNKLQFVSLFYNYFIPDDKLVVPTCDACSSNNKFIIS